MTEYLPPQSREAEQSTLGSILIDRDAMIEIAEMLQPGDFFDSRHALIYVAMRSLHDRKAPIDIVTVSEALERSGTLDLVGGRGYLSTLAGATPTSVFASSYAKIVAHKGVLRDLISAAGRISAIGYEEPQSTEEALDRADNELRKLRDRIPSDAQTSDPGNIIDRMENERSLGIQTRLPLLNHLTAGLVRGHLVVPGGWSSSGKALGLDAPILTPSGFVPMSDIRVGAEVIGSDGAAHRVTGVYPQGDQRMYLVTFKDGASVEASGDHLWFTQTHSERTMKKAGSVKTTLQIGSTLRAPLGKQSRGPNHRIGLVGPVHYVPRAEPLLDPYLMGILLGDGGFTNGNVRFTNSEAELLTKFVDRLPEDDAPTFIDGGVSVRRAKKNNDTSETKKALIAYGLDGRLSIEKFIPDDYRLGSIETRLAVLQGLCDTDGSVAESAAVDYTTSSLRLSQDVLEIVRSLGGYATVKPRVTKYEYKGEKKDGALSYRMYIRFPSGSLTPVTTTRKVERWNSEMSRIVERTVLAVEYVGVKPAQCITVDAPDSLFVTKDFILTHNSAVAVNLMEDVFLADGAFMVASTEMSQTQYMNRLLSLTSGVPQTTIRHGGMTLDQMDQYQRARTLWKSAKMRLFDDLYNVTRIRRRAKQVKRDIGLDVLFVDFLQNLSETGDEIKDMRLAIVQLQALAKELDCCVVAMSQISNSMAQQQNEEGGMANYYALKGSGAIKDAADVVIMLTRDRVNQPDVLWLNIVKNRHGSIGRIATRMTLDTGRISQLSDEEALDADPNSGRKSKRRTDDR